MKVETNRSRKLAKNLLAGILSVAILIGVIVLIWEAGMAGEKADIERILALPRTSVTVQHEGQNILVDVQEAVGEKIWSQYGEDLFSVALEKMNPGKWGRIRPGTKLVIPCAPSPQGG